MGVNKIFQEQRRLRFFVLGGILSMVLSVPMFFAGGLVSAGAYASGASNNIAGVWLSVIMFLGGAVALGYGLVKGLAYRDGVKANAPQGVINDAYIIGRYVLNMQNDIVDEGYLLDDLQYKYMVRVAMPDGRRLEMQTAEQVYFTVPENGTGRIYHQGTWITRFEFIPVVERPYHAPRL
ncbi:MAG: hypothetical protein JNJ45_08570 [Chthonomonas sp.]|nr:hypothetical protein [Chthonomonas sp.]